eukprot:856420-Prorocentrum_minimum.AAC.1
MQRDVRPPAEALPYPRHHIADGLSGLEGGHEEHHLRLRVRYVSEAIRKRQTRVTDKERHREVQHVVWAGDSDDGVVLHGVAELLVEGGVSVGGG